MLELRNVTLWNLRTNIQIEEERDFKISELLQYSDVYALDRSNTLQLVKDSDIWLLNSSQDQNDFRGKMVNDTQVFTVNLKTLKRIMSQRYHIDWDLFIIR